MGRGSYTTLGVGPEKTKREVEPKVGEEFDAICNPAATSIMAPVTTTDRPIDSDWYAHGSAVTPLYGF